MSIRLLGFNDVMHTTSATFGKGRGGSLISAFILLSVVETIKYFLPILSQPTHPLQDGDWLFFKEMPT